MRRVSSHRVVNGEDMHDRYVSSFSQMKNNSESMRLLREFSKLTFRFIIRNINCCFPKEQKEQFPFCCHFQENNSPCLSISSKLNHVTNKLHSLTPKEHFAVKPHSSPILHSPWIFTPFPPPSSSSLFSSDLIFSRLPRERTPFSAFAPLCPPSPRHHCLENCPRSW